MIQYPAGLPCFERTGYGLKTKDPQLRSELESGRSRPRRKFTQTPTAIEVVTRPMNDAQAQLFEAWWEQVLVSGTKWVDLPLKTPLGMQHYTAQFVGIYDGPLLVGVSHWRFSCTVVLRKRPLIPAPWAAQAPDWILNAGKFDRLMNDTWPEA
ncbi:hypothetical protein SAMN05216198_1042 [Halopseudomonas litoralis]|uniref:Uncharacterized protein n=1 Tax=Halopseudomonas litoralis TaxID=797277 RepID=A0A1H1P037_9GAMM|nr:hypothetical protein [Halopseudomonas litoralis]SDS03969.1 hypothetical protein SAMN05216198_1042 [Halopseudomonas litoralis]